MEAILGAISIPVQLGGGIRDLATIETWLAKGVARVILGTVAVREPGLVREACRRSPAASPSASMPRAARWRSRAGRRRASSSAIELARRFEGAGVAAIIYTDIDRDGVLQGLNLPATAALARTTPSRSSPPAASPASPTSRHCCAPEYRMLAGAIAGRALYDGRLDAREALTSAGLAIGHLLEGGSVC